VCECECNVCTCIGSVARGNITPAMAGSSVSATDPEELTLDNVKDWKFKTKLLKKDQLQNLYATLIGHIDKLKLELEKNKCPYNVSTPDKTFKLRAELKELKEAVFVNAIGTNACGDVPVGLTQEYWDTGDRQVIPWDPIHRLAAEQNGTPETSNAEDAAKHVVNAVVNAVNATSFEEGNHNTPSKAKSAKLAKLVKLAKSTALWCLLPYVPLSQEAKDKQRKVCPVNLRGRSARPTTAAAGTQRSVSWPTTARGRSPKPCACCGTCRSRSRPSCRETSPGGGAAPSFPPGSKGNNSNNTRPAKPDKYLVKLEAEYRAEELKARIRAQKMMSQGFTYS
jgi:hypothetical protein